MRVRTSTQLKGGIPPAPPRKHWRSRFKGSHLSCTSCPNFNIRLQAKKVHGVFPSCRGYTCIFTGTSISPSLSWRQCPNRYAFRAGRNLPDKEFRYLRTVIVTAAVYWGFDSGASLAKLHHHLTFQHRAGVSPYTSPFVFSRDLCFDKQLQPAGYLHRSAFWALTLKLAHLLPKLRGHFAEFLHASSLAHLRILILTTCVGFRYGHLFSI